MELSFADVFTGAGLMTLLSVVLIDLTMAGDNVVIMGTIAARLPERDRRRVIMLGVALALVFLIGFALAATWLLKLPGLMLAGGLTLVWVAWNLWRDLRGSGKPSSTEGDSALIDAPNAFLQAAVRITLADLSMSLDNVLAVAATARAHPTVLFFGLMLSVSIMGLAANLVARMVERHRWISWVGLAVILFVAGRMILDGWRQVAPWFGQTVGMDLA